MTDPIGQQPDDSPSMHVVEEGNSVVAAEAASKSASPEPPLFPLEHVVETGKIAGDALPTGTVTLLFTDMQGSTSLLQRLGNRYALVLTTCRKLLRAAFQQWNGHEVDTQGDAFFVAFARATDAVAAAVTAQRNLAAYSWPEDVPVRIRMGLHTGEPARLSEGYIGLDVHFAARLMNSAHGGQVLLSETTKQLVGRDLPEGVSLRDEGVHYFKDIPDPRHIFQLVIAGLPADFPPLRNLFIRFNNLPAQLASLVGREQEEAAVCTLLRRADVRLVTLTGTGGIGKTRLGLAVATKLLDSFADGACFVPLASISDSALVISTIAHLLGLDHLHAGSRSVLAHMEYLKAFFQDKRFLLVLDNFEQVAQAAPDLAELLQSCPHLSILVTSRAALHLQGEYEFSVPPLAFPTQKRLPASEELMQYAAIALFLQRALTVKPDFALTKTNIHAVAAISQQLDGLPLAIELAATRSKVLPPQALLQRLTHRLTVLTGGTQDAPARQQTLRNTIAWSYNLLDTAEQQLFRRLSVFVGGCTLEAIEVMSSTVAGEAGLVLDGVASLIDKNLLRQTEQEGTDPRLVMLETIREYGQECLASSGELEQIRQAHAQYYLHLAEQVEPYLYGPEQGRWLDRLEREYDNLRAAFYWSQESADVELRKEIALRMVGVLPRFWTFRGYVGEGQSWLEQALPHSEGAAPALRANALNEAAWLAFLQSDMERAGALCEAGLQCYREARKTQKTSAVALSLIWLVWVGMKQNDESIVRFLLDESRLLARETGDTRALALLLHFMAGAAVGQDKYAEARSLLEESLMHFRAMGDIGGIAWADRLLGFALFVLHDEAQAHVLVEESLAISRATHDTPGSGYSLFLLGRFALAQGNVSTAQLLFEESLVQFRTFGDRQPIAHALCRLANIAMQQGNEAVARPLYEESLTIFQQLADDKAGQALCLQGWGALVARKGAARWAAQLWGAAEVLRDVRNLRNPFLLFVGYTGYEQADYERMVSIVHTQLGEHAFASAWAEGRAMTPEQVLAQQGREVAPAPVIPVPQPPPATASRRNYPAGLTAREVQVLRMVAQGLTNNEIAEELKLSEKTIAHHLTHIFNKTSSENRAAATAFAIRHGLA